MSSYEEPSAGKIALWGIGAFVLIVVVSIVLAVGHWAFSWWAAPYQGKLQARQQIQSGDFRIQAYQHFFDLCASVQTDEEALAATLTAEKQDKGESLQIDRTNYVAQLNSRNDAANQYNAQTHEGYTVGQFKASNLPYEIAPYVKGVVTQCASS